MKRWSALRRTRCIFIPNAAKVPLHPRARKYTAAMDEPVSCLGCIFEAMHMRDASRSGSGPQHQHSRKTSGWHAAKAGLKPASAKIGHPPKQTQTEVTAVFHRLWWPTLGHPTECRLLRCGATVSRLPRRPLRSYFTKWISFFYNQMASFNRSIQTSRKILMFSSCPEV